MKNRQFILFFFFIFLHYSTLAQWQVTSPNGQIRATIQRSNEGKLSYSIDYLENSVATTILTTSPLGITRMDQDFTNNLTNQSNSNEVIDEHYSMITGKQSSLWNHANQLTLNFKNANNAQLQLIFRAYDDGVAFRYNFPENTGQTVNIMGESSGFSLPTNGKGWLQKYSIFNPSYEQYYTETPIGNGAPDNAGWAFPALFQANNYWFLLTEAALDENFYTSHLSPNANGGLYTMLPPDQNDGNSANYFATATLPFATPWRVIILGKNAGNIVESSLVHHLAAASKVSDISWIKPGLSSWSWWSDFSSPKDYNKLKGYVDFSKSAGLAYSLVDANWNQMTGGDLQQLSQYAQSQGVGIWAWYNSAGTNNSFEEQPRDRLNDPATRQAEMQKLKSWGVKGIKVDYFLSDKQALMKLYLDILKDAAANQLMVNFHGCTFPKGWQRTYPNLLSMEGVMGDENLLFNPGDFRSNSASHNVNLVFTRNVIGSMDYTPGIVGIDRVPHNTTAVHELALLTLFESGVSYLADKPTNYQAFDPTAQQIISQLPTTWDETHLIQGEPGKYAVVARRKGDNWYIAGINGGGNALTLNFTIPYLAAGNYDEQIIVDGKDAQSLTVSQSGFNFGQTQNVSLLPYGGFLMVLKNSTCVLAKPIITKNETVQSIILSVNVSVGNIQWLLNKVNIAGANTANYGPKQAGNYSVRITDNNCSAVSDEIAVSIPKPSITIIGNTSACDGDSIKLTVSSQDYEQFKWFQGNVQLQVTTNTLTVKKSDVYKVIGVRAKIDSEPSDGVTITFNPIPAKPTITLANGILSASGTGNFQWLLEGAEIGGAKNSSYTPSKNGNYSVKITNNNCSNTSDIFSFKLPEVLNVTIMAAGNKISTCEGDSITLTAITGFDSYKWLSGNETLNSTKNSIVVKKSGAYQVIVTKGSNQGASDILTITFYPYPPKPIIQLSANVLTSSGTGAFQWYLDGAEIAGAKSNSYRPLKDGNYFVKITTNICSNTSDIFSFKLPEVLSVTIAATGNKTSACEGDSITLTATTGFEKYKWLAGSDTLSSNKNSIVVKKSGVYQVIVTKGNSQGASDILTITFYPYPPKPTIQLVVNTLTSSGTGNFQWYLNGVEIAGAKSNTYTPSKDGNYSVKITTNICSNTSDIFSFKLPEILNVTITATGNKISACEGDSITLTATTGFEKYKWFVGNDTLSTNKNSIVVKKSGTYRVIVTKGNSQGISDTLSVVFYPYPPKPVIQLVSNILKSSGTGIFQWYLNGTEIVGAKSSSYTPLKDGNYSVKITTNSCSNTSDTFSFKLPETLKVTIAAIGGKGSACEGDSITLFATTGFEKYKWLLGNDTLSSNKSTIVVKKSGIYRVIVFKGALQGISDTLSVTFYAYPPKPVIHLLANTLISSSISGNQWYENGTLLVGETEPQLKKYSAKSYFVKVTQNGCAVSSDFFVITALSGTYENNSLKVYPNPTEGKVTINYTSTKDAIISVVDLNGKILLEKPVKGFSDTSELDLSNWTSGIYLLKISSEKWLETAKIFVK